VGFHTSTGSNELYYNVFIPSLTAISLSSWGLFFWLRKRYIAWSILLLLAAFLQPLVSFQLFLLTTCVLFFDKWFYRKTETLPFFSLALYLIFSLPWLILLSTHNGADTDAVQFMNIIEFRLSHHFFASYFGLIHLVIGLLFSFICISFYKGSLRWIFIFILSGCLFYEMGVEIFRWPVVLYTQWWKTTIWTEAFAFIAIIAFFEKMRLPDLIVNKLSLSALAGILLLVSFYRLSGFFGEKPIYLLPWMHSIPDEVDISLQANRLTSQDAIFIIPPEITAFKWYSKRSLYVDYKSMIHTSSFLEDWYHRIYQVYQFDLSKKTSGNTIYKTADEILRNPTPEMIVQWKSLGISHIISPSAGITSLTLLGKNSSFAIYDLQTSQ
jgi:hypothetical protein